MSELKFKTIAETELLENMSTSTVLVENAGEIKRISNDILESGTIKKITEMENLEEIPDTATVLVENAGEIKRVPSSGLGTKAIVEAEYLEEIPDTATVLIENAGEIKRVPSSGLGGGIKTAIIKDSNYDNVLAGIQVAESAEEPTCECINMTFEEAYQTMAMGEPLSTIFMAAIEGCGNINGSTMFGGMMLGVPCIVLAYMLGPNSMLTLYWTADGISMEMPGER